MARPTSVVPCFTVEATIDIPECAANTTTVVTMAVPGLRKGRPLVFWTEDALDAGLVISDAHASAYSVLTFHVGNLTALPINPAPMAFSIVQF